MRSRLCSTRRYRVSHVLACVQAAAGLQAAHGRRDGQTARSGVLPCVRSDPLEARGYTTATRGREGHHWELGNGDKSIRKLLYSYPYVRRLHALGLIRSGEHPHRVNTPKKPADSGGLLVNAHKVLLSRRHARLKMNITTNTNGNTNGNNNGTGAGDVARVSTRTLAASLTTSDRLDVSSALRRPLWNLVALARCGR